MSLLRLSIMALFAVVLSSCSFFGGDDDTDDEFGAGKAERELYDSAISYLESSQSRVAIDYLEALESQFPFGAYAEQAQLELIYAYYRSSNHDSAMASADRFIRLHPEHPNVDYAFYMRGLITFTREASFIGQFLPLDITTRDPGSARESFAYFSEFLVRYPNSGYGPDARKRLIYLRNLLSRHEINTANYYFKRGAYLAATNRGKFVVENFQGSPSVPDGLATMALGYRLLGYTELADNATRVLAQNYPEHPALDENGDFKNRDIVALTQRSWLNKATFGALDKPEILGFDTREMYNSEYIDLPEEVKAEPESREKTETQLEQRQAILPKHS